MSASPPFVGLGMDVDVELLVGLGIEPNDGLGMEEHDCWLTFYSMPIYIDHGFSSWNGGG